MSSLLEHLIVRGVRVVDPTQSLDARVDLIVAQGRVRACEPGAATSVQPAGRVIDGSGKVIFPALVELRARLGEPGQEYKEDLATGLRAAAAGGFGRVCHLPDTSPCHDRASVTQALLARARELASARLYPIAAATRQLAGQELVDMGELLEAGAIAFGDGSRYVASAAVVRRVMEYARTFDALFIQRPEEPGLALGPSHEGARATRLGLLATPPIAESIALHRDLQLAQLTDCRYHAALLSSEASLPLIRAAKEQHLRVSCDVAVHQLLLDETQMPDYDVRYRTLPPLRTPRDRAALLAAIADGTIDCITTDHHPQTSLERECEFAVAEPGLVGLQLALSLLWPQLEHAGLSALRLIDALSSAPARVLGLSSPSLRPGSVAEFVLFDPHARWTPRHGAWYSKCSNTPFFDTEVSGRVLLTTVDGRIIYGAEEYS